MQTWKVDHEPRPENSIQDLLINIPPGLMKSLLCCVFWPAWEWVDHPHIRSLFSSYAADLATRDSVRCRDLIQSEWYQSWFQPTWTLKEDQNVKTWFTNTAGGLRMTLSVGSKVTGFRGDKVVVDDSLNATDAHSEAKRKTANEWWDKAMSTRINDPRRAVKLSIQQRLHEDDLTGHCLRSGGYEHLCLPTEFDPDNACRTSIGFEDPRSEKGQLLFPTMFTPEVVAKAKRVLGSAGFASQHNQRPAPAGGLTFKRQWWRYWQRKGDNLPPVLIRNEDGDFLIHPVDLPEQFDEIAHSWDMTFKDTAGSDDVAGGCWGRLGANAFLLDSVIRQMSFTQSVTAVEEMAARWPGVGAIYIEDKANGPAVISTLENKIPGIIAINPDGGKIARANAVSPYLEAGNVFLPHPHLRVWVNDRLDQYTAFPNGSRDDAVDETTQVLNRFFGSSQQSNVWQIL